MSKLLKSVFAQPCSHAFSWPRRRSGGGYYQICVLCGDEYAYDWSTMTRGEQLSGTTADQSAGNSVPRWVPRARRLKTDLPALYRVKGSTDWHPAKVMNVSQSGLLLEASELLPKGDIELMFEMPQEISGRAHSRVLCPGRVSRSDVAKSGRCTAGVAIADYTFVTEH